MPTQAELEAFMAGQTPEQLQNFNQPRKKKPITPAQEAANLLSKRQASNGMDRLGFGGHEAFSADPREGAPLDIIQPAVNTPVEQLGKAKIDISTPGVVADVNVLSVAEVPKVTDRYQSQYDDAVSALAAFEARGVDQSPFDTGSSKYNTRAPANRARDKRFSPQRATLRQNKRDALALLTGGSFADEANSRKEQRQAQAATAANLVADANLKNQEFDFGEAEKILRKRTRGTKRSTITNEIYDELVNSLITGSK